MTQDESGHALTVGVGSGAGALHPEDTVITLGQAHPSTHGVIRLRLRVDGDTVTHADPLIGHLHRGAEKLFEVRDYRQIIMLANRHDWLSAFANELGVVLAVERLLGLEVPARATWIRTLLAELNRVLSHLAFLGTFPLHDRPPPTPGGFVHRERLQRLMEEVTGGRMHFMFNRVGGLHADLPAGWTGRTRRALDQIATAVADDRAVAVHLDPAADRLAGLGVLSQADALGYGVSGAVARASGLDLDLRRDDPYLGYAELANVLSVPVDTAGDALARVRLLHGQLQAGIVLAHAALDRVEATEGPVDVRLPKVLTVPEGETYAWTEGPLGISGYYLVSRGDKTPWRLKLRSASYNNVQALTAMLPGNRVHDLVPILASTFFVVGDVDK